MNAEDKFSCCYVARVTDRARSEFSINFAEFDPQVFRQPGDWSVNVRAVADPDHELPKAKLDGGGSPNLLAVTCNSSYELRQGNSGLLHSLAYGAEPRCLRLFSAGATLREKCHVFSEKSPYRISPGWDLKLRLTAVTESGTAENLKLESDEPKVLIAVEISSRH